MELQDLKDKLVAVLGFGQEGRAVTAYLMKHGIKPVLFDQKPWSDWPPSQQEGIKATGLNFIFGPDAFKELAGFDIAFRSPGIKLSEVTGYKLPVTSQTKWFFDHCPAKIIGVTGTKGKGTTSALIFEMLKAAKIDVYLTGNIGKTQPLKILDALKADDYVVYELSSFQLQDLDKSPHIGVVLMVTSEHLDYHSDVHEYIQAKEAITKFQSADDFAISNANYESSVDIGHLGKGKKLDFATLGRVNSHPPADCYVDNRLIYLKGEEFLDTRDLQLKGAHNWQNICAAILAAEAAGCDLGNIKKVVLSFKGLEHRLEFVAEKGGIKFYNDSFSTTPETAIAAIGSFTEPLIAILGGSSKNSDFSELGKTVTQSKNIKAVILIGREAGRIRQSFIGHLPVILEGATNMAGIFEQVKSIAQSGDVVLLSPACASFDMFSDYRDRGEQFKQQMALW